MNDLLSNRVILIDGSLSTELENLDYAFQDSVFWTGKAVIYNPSIIEQVHINYLKNGSKIVTTGSYQLNIDNLSKELKISTQESFEIIRRSVKIAREAQRKVNLEDETLIAGSVGPFGACQCDGSEYSGNYVDFMTTEDLILWHRPRIEALIQEKVDLLAIETIPSIIEAKAICQVLREHKQIKAWLSFSCRDGLNLCYGDKFSEAYNTFSDFEQLIAIGINCTSPYYIESLIKSTKNRIKPFIVYPNDGSIWDFERRRYLENKEKTIEIFNKEMPKWIDLGAKFIGGCCRIDSKDIFEIGKLLK